MVTMKTEFTQSELLADHDISEPQIDAWAQKWVSNSARRSSRTRSTADPRTFGTSNSRGSSSAPRTKQAHYQSPRPDSVTLPQQQFPNPQSPFRPATRAPPPFAPRSSPSGWGHALSSGPGLPSRLQGSTLRSTETTQHVRPRAAFAIVACPTGTSGRGTSATSNRPADGISAWSGLYGIEGTKESNCPAMRRETRLPTDGQGRRPR